MWWRLAQTQYLRGLQDPWGTMRTAVMKQVVVLVLASAALTATAEGPPAAPSGGKDKRGLFGLGYGYVLPAVPHLGPFGPGPGHGPLGPLSPLGHLGPLGPASLEHGHVRTITITKAVPYPVPQPYPVRVPVAVPVDRPYAVPVDRPVPYPVEKPVPYPVKVPVEVPAPAPPPPPAPAPAAPGPPPAPHYGPAFPEPFFPHSFAYQH